MEGSTSSTAEKNDNAFGYSSNAAKRSHLNSILSALLSDPIFSDVPKNPSLADVEMLVNLELGSAMKISIVKMDGSFFGVVLFHHFFVIEN